MKSAAARYNRIVKGPATLAFLLPLSLVLLSGCKKNIQSDDAVRQGIMSYLSKRPDLLSMDVNITSVSYRQNEATATVRFQAKGNTSPGASMTMQYVLERQGDQWQVKGRAGANDHGAAALPPPDGAAGAGGAGSIGAMPNTAPPAAPPGALPPGHPPVSSDKKPGQSK